jgi:voltage-gated potassium channel
VNKKGLNRERWNLLVMVRNTISPLMDILSFVWLALTIYDLSQGLSHLLENFVTAIWIIFAIHFLTEFLLAPKKKIYLTHNWLTGISLFLPAFRVFRFLRVFRYLRGLRSLSLIKIVSSINRGMRSLSNSVAQKVFLYVLCLTIMVIFSGAAGILNFEGGEKSYISGFGSALWWSAMMVTTMGTDYFPESSEGRSLAFALAVYGFAVFGYVAASLASYLMGRVKKVEQKPSTEDELRLMRQEIRELKDIIWAARKEGYQPSDQ